MSGNLPEPSEDMACELASDLLIYGNAVVHYVHMGDGTFAARRLDPHDVFPELAKYLAADRLPKEEQP